MSVTTKAAHRAANNAVLEFQSPTAAVIAESIPAGGRLTIRVIATTVLSSIAISGAYPVDRVITVPGKIVAKVPNIVVQPLDTSIVRQIAVHEGQLVHAGDKLAMLDPKFAAADAGATDAQVASLQAEVDRLEAEVQGRSYVGSGSQPSQLQAMLFAQRHAEQAARSKTTVSASRARVPRLSKPHPTSTAIRNSTGLRTTGRRCG